MTGLAAFSRFVVAARAGKFARLPADNYEHRRTVRLTFGTDSMGLTE